MTKAKTKNTKQKALLPTDPDAGISTNAKKLIYMINKANGFELAETRRIRAELRELARTQYSGPHKHDFSPTPTTIINAFIWCHTKQGYKYWSTIHTRLCIAGAYAATK